jgi:hypothetical protein
MIDRARYRFRVCEYESNAFWIMAEPLSSDIKILKHGILGFDLPTGASMDQAQQVADFFNKNVRSITYTGIGT